MQEALAAFAARWQELGQKMERSDSLLHHVAALIAGAPSAWEAPAMRPLFDAATDLARVTPPVTGRQQQQQATAPAATTGQRRKRQAPARAAGDNS
jgi:hypothetical protein